ncbi:MAG: AAA family ATPase [Pseudomonadota bacterium]
MPELQDIEALLRSHAPIIISATQEEARVTQLFQRLALRLCTPVFTWTVTDGLRMMGQIETPRDSTRDATDALVDIKMRDDPGLFLLIDFHPFLEDPVHVRLLKDIAQSAKLKEQTLVLIAHKVKTPPELAHLCAHFSFSVPNRDRLMEMVLEEAQAWSQREAGKNIRTTRRMLERLVDSLTGLPADDAKRLTIGAFQDGTISDADLPPIMKAKFERLNQDGVLSFEYDVARFADIGGLSQLKDWLKLRYPVFSGELQRKGLDAPKGILLLGVQGCGKSLAAKAVAGSWHAPLLRLDFGSLYNKYHGETERNLRESLRAAEAMAPCVLWIDEIEKGVGGDSHDGGTSRRVLGTLLTWMAENKERVFIVATANDIENMPPELLRKGRLDEIFFVDLPDEATRQAILEVHLKRRELPVQRIDVEKIASETEGFSGSELEQLIVAAVYAAHAQGHDVTTDHLSNGAATTRPLSVVMSEKIASLRHWASARTVPAN